MQKDLDTTRCSDAEPASPTAPSVATFECTCSDCQSACKRKPGWFMPGQVETLAANLGMTPEQLFRERLAVDWWARDSELDETFVLSPAIVSAEAGTEFPADPIGECAFYKDGKCEIHALGKPFECAALTHEWSANHLSVATAWVPHQDQIRKLLGREPESALYWGGGILSLLGPR